MHAVRGMEKSCGSASRSQCRGDFSSDQSGLADPGNDNSTISALGIARLSCSFRDALNGVRKLVPDTPLSLGEGVGFHPEDTSPALDDVLACHRLTRAQTSTARSTRPPISDSGSMLGPSLGAQSGSGWVSRKRPCAPAAMADKARTGTNSRAPPLAPSGPCPGF